MVRSFPAACACAECRAGAAAFPADPDQLLLPIELTAAATELTATASAAAEEKATASGMEVGVGTDGPARRIQLFPMGRQVARDGRVWELVDRAHAEQVVAATLARLGSAELMIDYDHQAVTAEKVGGTAPAAGWVKQFHVQDDGIWADVEWTAPAAEKLARQEYRYISPWFGFDKETLRLTRFFNAALTNTPALELAAVASERDPGATMDPKAIAKALGLAETATEAEVLAAISKQNTLAATASASVAAIAKAIGLAADAKPDEVVATATALKSAGAGGDKLDPAKFVPMEQFALVKAQLAGIQEDKATAAVDAAIKAGKLAPAARDWGLDLAKRDATAFAKFVDVAPAVLGENGQGLKTVPEGGLTAEERAICKQLGLTEDEFKASKEGYNK